MAQHKVSLELKVPELSKIDTIFEIKSNGVKLGTLKISKGGIDYTLANKKIPIKKSWKQFDELFRTE